MISPGGFFLKKILIFWAVRGVKGQKMAQNEKITITSVMHHISVTV